MPSAAQPQPRHSPPAVPSFRSRSAWLYKEELLRCAVRSATLMPSQNRVRKRTFAFVNRPSLTETTINYAPRNRVRKSVPICCVRERSSAASISSGMYFGAGLNFNSAIISDSVMSDVESCTSSSDMRVARKITRRAHRWPPLGFVKLFFTHYQAGL